VGSQDAPGGEQLAHHGAGVGILVDPLGDDVASACEGLFSRFYTLLGVDVLGGLGHEVHVVLVEEALGQRLEALLLGDGGACAALGPEGEVDVLEDRHGLGGEDALLQIVREQLAFLKRLEDCLPPLVQFVELHKAVSDRGDLHLVEAARGLLAVAGDEGDGGVLFE